MCASEVWVAKHRKLHISLKVLFHLRTGGGKINLIHFLVPRWEVIDSTVSRGSPHTNHTIFDNISSVSLPLIRAVKEALHRLVLHVRMGDVTIGYCKTM